MVGRPVTRRRAIIAARMAEKLGFWQELLYSDQSGRDRAQSNAINQNAEELEAVEANLEGLRTVVQRQAQEILHLRAMVMGIVEILRAKVALDEAELAQAAQAAYSSLVSPPRPPPPPPQPSTDPYRNAPGSEPSPDEVAAAKSLLKKAEDLHFHKRFQEAREIYQQIVDKHGGTKPASVARQQLENLRGV